MKKFIIVAAILVCGNVVWASQAQMYKLDNGQTVVVQEVKNNPIVTIDTWIKKMIDGVYGGHFDTTPYEGFEGFVQQLQFYYYRYLKGKKYKDG